MLQTANPLQRCVITDETEFSEETTVVLRHSNRCKTMVEVLEQSQSSEGS